MSECIPWAGRINRNGYGTIGHRLAHRVIYEHVTGAPIPDGLTLDHACHDPKVCHAGDSCPHRRCINVGHLEPLTRSANAARSSKRHTITDYCPSGHYRGRRTYCPMCRASRARTLRAVARVQRCMSAGHEPELVTDASGRTACRLCRTGGFAPRATCRKGHPKRPGKCAECAQERSRDRKRADAAARCAERGHTPSLATMVNGKTYCTVCRSIRPGRPARA